jgi:hypothetical protein
VQAAHIWNGSITRGTKISKQGVVGAMAGSNGGNSGLKRRYALMSTAI